MYEIVLALNILWELAASVWPAIALAGIAWLALMAAAASRGRGHWRAGLPAALAVGAGVALAAFLALPSLTRSSLSELRYWVDWANLAAIALGVGGVCAAFAWPVRALRLARRAAPATRGGPAGAGSPGAAA